MEYFIGIDIGGTFTDAWAIRSDGIMHMAKTSSTPPQFERGFMNALEELAMEFEISMKDMLNQTRYLGHGTTVATNIMVQRTGSKVGLLVTAGHRDALSMMRATGRAAGLNTEALADTKNTDKPTPLVPPSFIHEVHERIDVDGDVVVPLRMADVDTAISIFQSEHVQAIGIAFLWSFVNIEHERAVKNWVHDHWPSAFVATSHELSPQIGEYERIAAVAVNCYVGPETRAYLDQLQSLLQDMGYQQPLYITQCAGGVMTVAEAALMPMKTFQSGPVAGINAASRIGGTQANIITTDMGGTSFDVGLVVQGHPLSRKTTIVEQYEYLLPTIDIQSIGAGGGSIAWFDETQQALKVGPRSAGAVPGPACYGRGGVEPTVTDADVVLGYLNPDYFLGGHLALNANASYLAMERLAKHIGLDVISVAAGIVEIVDRQMGDLVRRLTLGKGYDPREFQLLAYGGAGPIHAAGFARDIGVKEVIVPGSAASSVWSAYGATTSDLVQVLERGCYFKSPFDRSGIRIILNAIREQFEQKFRGAYEIFWTADMHYTTQISELEVPLPDCDSPNFSDMLLARFQEQYEQTYGRESGFHEVEVEIITLRGRAQQSLGQPAVALLPLPPTEEQGVRSVYWPEWEQFIDTPIYRVVTSPLMGPLIVELPVTSVVVHPNQSIRPDGFGNLIITLHN